MNQAYVDLLILRVITTPY